ncbi:hypothetical protein N9E48_02150 [Paracoccaceae bacterium]|nr:hypothetical protein [Paracoccaceae bacterium]
MFQDCNGELFVYISDGPLPLTYVMPTSDEQTQMMEPHYIKWIFIINFDLTTDEISLEDVSSIIT